MEKSRKPKIRFKGYNDDWEQRKLEEILIQRIQHQKITSNVPLLAFSYAEGVIDPNDKKTNKRDFIMTDKYNKIFSKTEKNDIIYNPANVIHGAIHRNKLGIGVVSPIYKIFICQNINPKFLGERLHTDEFIAEIAKYIEGSVIKLRTLSPEQFLDMSIEIPSSRIEQEKIGSMFENLDNLITLHQRKLDKLINVKKSMLEKMFPKQGSTVPEIRFNGFTHDWEQRKLGEIADFYTGNGLSWNDISENGNQECILYGNLYTDYGMIAENVVYRTNTVINTPVYSEFGDVLIPASDTTPTGLARATSIEKSGVLLGGDINIVRPKKGINGSYLSLAINRNKGELIKLIKGTTVRHIHNSEIKGVIVSLPNNLCEQEIITECFRNLDHLITLHQRKLEKLKNIKKSMLEKMFI